MSIKSTINVTGLGIGAAASISVGTSLERDPFAPNYELVVRGGKGAQPVLIGDKITAFIDEISFEDNADQFDVLNINFSNQMDNHGGGDILSLIDSKIFSEGTIIEVRMGWGKLLQTIGAAQIVKKSPNYGTDGVGFSIEAYDLLHNAARSRPVGGQTYTTFRDSQIASIIGSRNGFDIAIKDPQSFDGIRRTKGIFKRVQKIGVSDYEFLKKLAEINAYDLFSRFDPATKKFGLFFQPAATKNQKEVFTFVYNEGEAAYVDSLLSFEVELDAFSQGTDFEIFIIKNKNNNKIKHKFIDRFTTEAQARLKADEERRFTGGNAGPEGGKQTAEDDGIRVAFKAFGRSFRFPPYKRFKDIPAARLAIERFIKKQKENFITGKGTIIGKEAVQSRQVHNFVGLGAQFSGKYYLNQITHTMKRGEGYIGGFSCRKVIEDFVVQAIPGLDLTENDKTFEKTKKLRK